ncbi:hypothetical protein HZZ13_02315 [Bradyrhizobium sp. CNPSo 4010]|uniref:Uncharacterized protein n=1 Tax=Bradyrhizobium agreste TaxID=2751811 RepID=A0ABS0PHF9_9BRAD|nr:hypothetical protein [Bradyrhizobium agreste]MBH5396633.1 hypothetical protein [Bradyrhizobium agreste]
MARKKDVAKKKRTIRSTAKLTTLDDFLGEKGVYGDSALNSSSSRGGGPR